MIINAPTTDHIPALRELWKQAFGDTDAFLDGFFRTGFSPDRCRCVFWDDQPIAAHYWFNCDWQDKKIAYLYAVATDVNCRGQGLCRALIENTHLYLKLQGYTGTVLVPGSPDLAAMYKKLGYKIFCYAQSSTVFAAAPAIAVTAISPLEFAQKRPSHLPENAVIHGTDSFAFLETFCHFYEGENFLLCAAREENTLHIQEFLGDTKKLPGILTALKAEKANVRLPGSNAPFAMYHSLTDDPSTPAYFGIALD